MTDKQNPDYLNALAEEQNKAPDQLMDNTSQLEQVVVTNDKGEPVLCDILLNFESDDTGKGYLIYTDNSIDEFGSVIADVAVYDLRVGSSVLSPVESEDDWALIDAVMAQMEEETMAEEEQD